MKSSKNHRPVNKPWFSKDCKVKRKQFMKAKRAYKLDKTPQNMANLKTYSKAYKLSVRKAYQHYHEALTSKLRSLKSNKPKEYWDIINQSGKGHVSSAIPPLNELYAHFKELNMCQAETPDKLTREAGEAEQTFSSNNAILNRAISTEEISKAISLLKNNKSCGVDGILNEYIKSTEAILLPLYTKLFNAVLNTGIIPKSWSVGKIIPIYKNKGDPEKVDSYRGITILSCFGKLFTSVLNIRIEEYINEAKILGLEQAGFRKSHSTVDHIFMLKCLVHLHLQKSKRLYCAFIDFEKAFDKVDRSLLWVKLLTYNVNGKVLNVIQNLYNQAKLCVVAEGTTSDFLKCSIGVRQGENLSPILFALYLNDLEGALLPNQDGLSVLRDLPQNLEQTIDTESLLKLFLLLYADDTTLMADSPNSLQRGLNAMSKYCETWKLKVNTNKTKIVIFSRGKVRKKPTITYNDTPIEIVDDFTFLGSLFNYNGKFNKARKRACDQASKAMFAVISKARKLNLPVDIQLHLFDSVVQPILLYGSEVWGFEDCKNIERVHLKFCKIVMGVSQFTTSAMVYGELGRSPVSIAIKTRMIAYWHKLLTTPGQKLSSTMYGVLQGITSKGRGESKWLSYVKEILNECGLNYIWQNQNTSTRDINTAWLKAKVKLILHDQFLQNWQEMVNTNENCNTYRTIKPCHKIEQYLLRLPFNYRNIITKFRCRNLRLPASPRVFHTVQTAQSNICPLCDLNVSGDELHYLLKCPALNNMRDLLNLNLGATPDEQKIAQVFNNSCAKPKGLIGLAKFLYSLSRMLKDPLLNLPMVTTH